MGEEIGTVSHDSRLLGPSGAYCCKPYFRTTLRASANHDLSEKEAKPDANQEVATAIRPVGLSITWISYTIVGAYYLIYPLLVQDVTLIPLYVIGALSLAGAFGVLKMSRWGLWFGLVVFPAQVIAPSLYLQVALKSPGLATSYGLIAAAASLVLLFLSVLSFLQILDKRRSFK